MFNPFKRKIIQQPIQAETLDEKIAKAKQQLISDLEKKGMKFLVTSMDCEDDYTGLIAEQRKINFCYSSTDSVSWYAYRQSEKLKSDEDKKELLALLSSPDYSTYKKYIYRCLSAICCNTNDKELFNFLSGNLLLEEDEDIRVAILSQLHPVIKDTDYQIEPIKLLVKEGRFDESLNAIKALSNCSHSEVEDVLLDEFKITTTHMKGMICGPLSTVGSLKSIPFLKDAYKKTRDQFLRTGINDAVYKIETRAKNSAAMENQKNNPVN